VIAGAIVFGTTLLAIGLMAYFAVRRDPPGPRCGWCDHSMRPDARECPSCHRLIG